MDSLLMTIYAFVDDHFPRFVHCVLIDATGCEHQFVEKVPIVSSADLRSDSCYPQPGYIACVIQNEWVDERGRQLARVCTRTPWGVESVAGETKFTVLRKQIVHD